MFTSETRIYFTILIGIAVLTTFLVFFLVVMLKQHKQKRDLELGFFNSEMKMQQKERSRIARDLHDELGPLLASVRLQLKACKPGNQNIIDQSVIHIEEALTAVKSITNDLEPVNLHRKSLWTVLPEIAGNINRTNTINLSLELNATPTLPKETEIHLLRMINEIIHNARRHAQATDIVIQSGMRSQAMLTLIIEDNGCGFDYENELKNNKGLGLNNIVSRVNLLKGLLSVDTEIGKGTFYKIEIPVGHANKAQARNSR